MRPKLRDMFQTKINSAEYNVSHDGEQFLINNDVFEWDIVSTGSNKYHIIYNNQSYNAELVSITEDRKSVSLKIEGQIFDVAVKDKFDLLLEKLGMTNLASSKINDIKAPMPGLILSIEVEEGQEVKKGDTVMILEAMKMENVLKSPGDGVVKAIKVKQGDSVEKNAVLIQF